jgi:hypothetical protein
LEEELEMLSVAEAFTKFKSRLEISDSEASDASRRQTAIRKELESSLAVADHFLTGSYSRHTKTRPLKDVDIFVVLNESECAYLDGEPSAILDAVHEVLRPIYGHDRVTYGRRSVRVDFGVSIVADISDRVVSIDVTPAFAEASGYRIPDRHSGTWISTNPRVHAQLATEANAAFGGYWKPLVKMIKKWNDHNDKPVKPSFLLEVMALKLLDPPWSGSYPRDVRQFFASAYDRLDQEWPDPARLGPAVSDRLAADAALKANAAKALASAEQACTEALRLDSNGSTGASLDQWQSLFGPLFVKS